MAVQQKIRIKIPRGYSPAIRERIATDIIKYIKNRTKKESLDKNESKFAKYSKEYSKEKRKRKVNLNDTGDMLENIELLTHRSGSLTIGYKKGYDGMGKVEGNRKGTYGQSKPIPGKARDFLGIVQEEVDLLLDKYPRDGIVQRRGEIEEDLSRQAESLSSRSVEQLATNSFLRQLRLE